MKSQDAEVVCRICYDGPNKGDVLLSNVCACKGTVAYIHRSCLTSGDNPICTICAAHISTSHAVRHRTCPHCNGSFPTWYSSSRHHSCNNDTKTCSKCARKFFSGVFDRHVCIPDGQVHAHAAKDRAQPDPESTDLKMLIRTGNVV
jgi:hypothetical protein